MTFLARVEFNVRTKTHVDHKEEYHLVEAKSREAAEIKVRDYYDLYNEYVSSEEFKSLLEIEIMDKIT